MTDWRRNQQLLIEGCERRFRGLFEGFPDEQICSVGFTFELGNAHPAFDLCANTRRDFEEAMARYGRDWPETTEEEIRWNSGDFKWCAGLPGPGPSVGPDWEAEYNRIHYFLDDHPDRDRLYVDFERNLINICCTALAVLAVRGAFGDWTAIDFIVQGYDENWTGAKARDQEIRRLILSDRMQRSRL